MKIDPADLNQGKNFDLQHQCIVPRPVFLVSTISETGVFNVAPFSFFAAVTFYPPTVCFSVLRRKGGAKMDTLRNIEFSRDFVANTVHEAIAIPAHQSSAAYPPEVSEFVEVGLTPVKSEKVKAPRVGESVLSLECKVVDIVELYKLPQAVASLVIGEIVMYHVKDEYYFNGNVDLTKAGLIGVMGGDIQGAVYCHIGNSFRYQRPSPPKE